MEIFVKLRAFPENFLWLAKIMRGAYLHNSVSKFVSENKSSKLEQTLAGGNSGYFKQTGWEDELATLNITVRLWKVSADNIIL